MTQKIDYSTVDAAILAAIATGCHRMTNFEKDTAVHHAVHDVHVHTGIERPYYRTIDARLQSLKRQGKIQFWKKAGWRLKEKSQ